MARLIFWRLVQLPILLVIIYVVTFFLAWVVPPNPLQMEGRQVSQEIADAMLAKYPGITDDYPFRFAWEHAKNLVRGDFGLSLHYKDWTVNEIIARSLPISVQLGLTAIVLALCIGVPVGIVGAVRKGTMLDASTMTIALIGISLPTFVTGTILLSLFGVAWGLLPIGGWGTLEQLALPALTLSLPFAAYIARLTRMGLIDVLSSDFIRTARAKGASGRKVIFGHALKNAFLPVLSFLGPATAGAMTGSFVVEKVFNVPGMGQHFVAAVSNNDLTLIMGVVIIYAVILILFNLLVDVAYHLVDPRIEL